MSVSVPDPLPLPVRSRPRRLVWWASGFALAAGVLWVAGVGVWAGWRLARPEGRDLGERQRKELANPSSIGLRLTEATAADGTPYLYCLPDPVAGPGERGKSLRDQMSAEGDTLPAYGFTSATVVLLHGRNGSKEKMLGIAERFAAAGFACLIPDLPGHGKHPARGCGYGVGPGEAGLAQAVCDDAVRRFGLPESQPRVLWGMSMGGSFALHAAASAPKNWAGVVVVSSFAHLGEVFSRELARWTGPAMPMARAIARQVTVAAGGMDPQGVIPETVAGKVGIPALIVHGSADPLIPLSQGERLKAALASKDKSWIEVAGANHWNVLVTSQPVYAPMLRWARGKAEEAMMKDEG